MEIRQLKCFLQAAKLLNFSEAAKAMCINQSSFSQNIKQLEEELKVTLFHRNTHETSLTQAGLELLPFATNVIMEADNCVNRMNDLLEMRCGTLNIGVTHSFSIMFAEALQTFTKRFPGIKVNITYRPMNVLMELLVSRDVDFVLSYRPSGGSFPQVVSHTLFEDQLSAIVRSDHPLAKRKSIPITELAEYPLALPTEGLHAREVLDRLAALRDIQLNVRVQLDLVSPLLRLVRYGMFITVLSKSSVENESELVAVPIDADGARMEGCIHMLKEDYRKEAAKQFVQILSESITVKNRVAEWFK